MNKTLTAKKKGEYFPILVQRDRGFKCFYCKADLIGKEWIYEHLDDNPANNRVENIVFACQSCNIKKKDNFDMKILALEKKGLNEESNFLWGRENVETSAPTLSTEIDANQQNFELVNQALSEIIETDGKIE